MAYTEQGPVSQHLQLRTVVRLAAIHLSVSVVLLSLKKFLLYFVFIRSVPVGSRLQQSSEMILLCSFKNIS